VRSDGFDPARALVPAAGDEARVREGLARKIARFAAKIPFAGDVVALWYAARDPATPTKTKALMLAALSYFVLPTDAIPDVFAGVGFTDDAAVIAAMIALAGSAIKPQHRARAKTYLEKVSR
jgi:uncharacterized membrane protein YkvA (DUF1232 family)